MSEVMCNVFWQGEILRVLLQVNERIRIGQALPLANQFTGWLFVHCTRNMTRLLHVAV